MPQLPQVQKSQAYNLSPAARITIAVLIFIALNVDAIYSNLILGGIAGSLLYPLVEYFLTVIAD
jgi:hypothetical protein